MTYKDKTLLITGGTGSFGNAVLTKFLKTDIKEIRIFSRDEKKQEDMRSSITDPRIKFYLGDVRKSESIKSALNGVNFLFHAAALKQVPSCEFYPMEAIETNILGTVTVFHRTQGEKQQSNQYEANTIERFSEKPAIQISKPRKSRTAKSASISIKPM